MDTQRTIIVHAGVAHLAYGMALSDKKNFKNPLAFDDYDLWFGNDFDFFLGSIIDDLLDDIESDITSVDSTNLSEAASEQASAQSSADRAAMKRAGLLDSNDTSAATADEVSRVSTLSSELAHENSTDSGSVTSVTSDEEETTTLDHSLGDHGIHHKHGYHHTTESDYSGRSVSDDDSSGLSNSLGTSQATGEASTLSTVSFTVKEYANVYADNNSGAFVNVLERGESVLTPGASDQARQNSNPF